MATSSNHQETRALHLAVADWLTPAEADEEASAKRWWAIGKEDDAAAFSTFLDRLKKTKNNQATDFHVQIASWISQLAQDDELRAKTFDMATESTSSCEDRVTLAMNNMKSVQLVHNAEKGKFDHDIPGLVSAGREMFRLEQLDLIAREKVKKLRAETYEDDNVDEIEVFLGYQNKLKESLELTGTTEGMQFFGASRITELDLKAAEIQVKSAENSQFREWILQWEPLHDVLIRKEAEDWKALINKKIEDYEREYQTLYDTELEPAGLLGDIEAERTIGARAMASAEKAFQQGPPPPPGASPPRPRAPPPLFFFPLFPPPPAAPAPPPRPRPPFPPPPGAASPPPPPPPPPLFFYFSPPGGPPPPPPFFFFFFPCFSPPPPLPFPAGFFFLVGYSWAGAPGPPPPPPVFNGAFPLFFFLSPPPLLFFLK
ncbi:hypothetical protein STH22820_12120 [Edwardsiella ictaluri]|nr:hypothetical protein STH22820_12120 [Edwardsiella ictaluri]